MQKKPINTKVMTAIIILLGLTSPLSTDMCLPAMPTIADDFGISFSVANLQFIVFFLFMAISTLVSGPFSDRFGRKRVTLASLALFSLGNLICSASPTIAVLLAGRIVSACGAGGMISASTALTKDVFSGYAREFTLHFVQAFHILGPLLAPSIGAFLLNAFGWHSSFLVLAGMGVVQIILVSTQPDASDQESGTQANGLTGIFDSVRVIMKNKPFLLMLLVAGMMQACFMTYLATSSYIYIVNFGVSAMAYGVFFGLCGLCAMSAPVIYLKILYPRFSSASIYKTNQLCIALAGAAIVVIGILQGMGALDGLGLGAPTLFMCCWAFVMVNNAIARPLGTSIMLKQHDGDNGSLSSLINFGLYMIGLVGMCLGSIGWGNYVLALGVIVAVVAAIATTLFRRMSGSLKD